MFKASVFHHYIKTKSSFAFIELNILIFLCISAYEPCKLGCNDMEFCTNFNNRPTSLFRSCSKQSDSVARKEFQNWLLTKRPLSPQLQLPVKGWGLFFYVHLITARFIFNMTHFLHCFIHIFAYLLVPYCIYFHTTSKGTSWNMPADKLQCMMP